ncbi:hypothetical protein KIN20_017862 [Parelaphostrongylus tenuis]|uniref:Uncharacterized protein n=1 Tax=Parelaphostrongylus tenuis TaxID=148309 RepID=A0AAD5MM34_PARTN|nr:hypothetical protein KIN20_017862 [Parelaphostrongylus tenuis]
MNISPSTGASGYVGHPGDDALHRPATSRDLEKAQKDITSNDVKYCLGEHVLEMFEITPISMNEE